MNEEIDRLKEELENLKNKKQELLDSKKKSKSTQQNEIIEDPYNANDLTKFVNWVKSNKIATFLIIGLFVTLLFNNTVGFNSDNQTLSTSPIDTTSTTSIKNEIMDDSVASLEEVIDAVVRIESIGLSDTDGYQDIGVGTGFFINKNGYIVTNNHVVAGSQGIEVTINNSDLPLPATLIGTSECNDLAVIKINGTDYKYLKWYEGEITPGLEIFAAGYPLATKEYTLLEGIVSKKGQMVRPIGRQLKKS